MNNDKTNARLALNTLRSSQPFNSRLGMSIDSYYKGRRLAGGSFRQNGQPNMKGVGELLGYLECLLETMVDDE